MRASASFNRPHIFVNSITGNTEGANIDIQTDKTSRAVPFGPRESSGAATQSPSPPPARTTEANSWSSALSQLGKSMKTYRRREQGQLIQQSIDSAADSFATAIKSYRFGPEETNHGVHEWWLIPNPEQTAGCFFRAPADTATSFTCNLFNSPNRKIVEATYGEWLESAEAVIPADWQRINAFQMNGGLSAERFVSPSGVVFALFIEQPNGNNPYTLFFAVVLPG